MDSARTRRPAGNDRSRTQRAALRVGLWVGLASAAIMGLIIAITIPVIALASRPDRRPGRGGGRFEDRVVGLSDLVPLAVVLVIVGVVAPMAPAVVAPCTVPVRPLMIGNRLWYVM